MEKEVNVKAHTKKFGFWYYVKRYTRQLVLCLVLASVFAVTFLWYFCNGESCVVGSASFRWHKHNNSSLLAQDPTVLQPVDFNIKGSDVMVFLHIQNTGGDVFARHLVEDLALDKPCVCRRKRCRCFRPNRQHSTWLFSRYTMGWKCGVHPDWSQLSSCADRVLDEYEGKPLKRRYFYVTVLRDPVKRFLSEYWHVQQGTGWRSARHWCRGREVSSKDLPHCFQEDGDVPPNLQRFMDCPHNLAANRQTRMLADLALVDCYNRSAMPSAERDIILLNSAKHNLHRMAFFGLAEFPKVSSYMFETTFGLTFLSNGGRSHQHSRMDDDRHHDFTSQQIDQIKDANALDMELYEYAKELLFFRFKKLKTNDPEFEDNFRLLNDDRMSVVDWADSEDSNDSI